MNPYSEIDTRPGRRALLELSLVFLAAALVSPLVAWLWTGTPAGALGFAVVAACLAVTAQIPGVGRALYVAWMALGRTLNLVVSPIVLGVLFLGVFLPMSLVLRFTSRDPLRLSKKKQESYWEPKEAPPTRESFFHQF